MKHLTYWQRIALIEYLMVHDNLPRCRTVARELVDEAYSIIEEQDYRALRTVEEVEAATAHINKLLSEAVERWLDLHKLYNHRESCQFQLIRDRGTFRPVPRGIVRTMLDGESKIDLFEFYKLPDGTLKNLAAPYFVEDLDTPLVQADRDRMTQDITEWLQPEYQRAAFSQFITDVQRETKKFEFELMGEGLLRSMDLRLKDVLCDWLIRQPLSVKQNHHFAISIKYEHDSYQVVFSPDFDLLGRGEHPLDFVNITRDTWTDRMLRDAHHEQTIKQLRVNFRNV